MDIALFAATSGDTDLLKFLIEMGADVAWLDRYNQTAFAYAKGNVARTLIRNEQTKGQKRAEAAEQLADIETIIEEVAAHIEQLEEVEANILHIEDRVSVHNRQKAELGAEAVPIEEDFESDINLFREGVGSQRLLLSLKEDTEKTGALAKKKVASTPEEVLAELQTKKDLIFEHLLSALVHARELLTNVSEAQTMVYRLMDGYTGRLPLSEKEKEQALALFDTGRLAEIPGTTATIRILMLA